jgi:hypothetical protein
MIQTKNGMHLGAVEDWSEAAISDLLSEALEIDLSGVRVYVVGAGATTRVDTTPERIEGVRRFWTRWFEQMGARVEFYGANLALIPDHIGMRIRPMRMNRRRLAVSPLLVPIIGLLVLTGCSSVSGGSAGDTERSPTDPGTTSAPPAGTEGPNALVTRVIDGDTVGGAVPGT